MQIAVLSDIHSNATAFARCLLEIDARGIQTIFFLGDYIGEMACPQDTLRLLQSAMDTHACTLIRGNKEEYWLHRRAGDPTPWRYGDTLTGALLYAYERLTARDLDFFARLPIARTVRFPDLPAVLLCHGTPERVNGRMGPGLAQTAEILEKACAPWVLSGHTHRRGKVEHAGRCAVNVGSVGLPLPGAGETQFVILHGADGAWREEFVSLSYDVEAEIDRMRRECLFERAPGWSRVTERILRGSDISQATVLSRAMEICRQETGVCAWPQIPEACWRCAEEELFEKEEESE